VAGPLQGELKQIGAPIDAREARAAATEATGAPNAAGAGIARQEAVEGRSPKIVISWDQNVALLQPAGRLGGAKGRQIVVDAIHAGVADATIARAIETAATADDLAAALFGR
jgi:hypothetical protein